MKALPDQLPQSFSISIEGLADFDAKLHVRDLEIPAGVTLLTDPGEVLAHVLAPRVEEAAAAAPTETAPGTAAGVSAAGEAETAGGSESAEG